MAFNPIGYIRESKAELDKVVWPTPKQTLRLTLVVIFVSVVVGAYIAGLDAILTTITDAIVK